MQAKTALKTKLQVNIPSRSTVPPGVVIIDGCALLWTVHWPASGSVQDYLDSFTSKIMYHMRNSDVYLIFDRYLRNSAKNVTRAQRAGASREHQLPIGTPLPAQKVILTVPFNKCQLIDFICDHLVRQHTQLPGNRRPVITGKDPIPIQVYANPVTPRDDLRTTQEEADVIIVHQLVTIAASNDSTCSIKVACDDTYVFVLLVHFYDNLGLSCRVILESPAPDRSVIDIKATTQ